VDPDSAVPSLKEATDVVETADVLTVKATLSYKLNDKASASIGVALAETFSSITASSKHLDSISSVNTPIYHGVDKPKYDDKITWNYDNKMNISIPVSIKVTF
jgi:hypothetical protein